MDFGSEARQTTVWKEATVRDLNLPAVVSVTESSPCDEAVAKMQKGGFDQLPVVDDKGALRGLVTLGVIPLFRCLPQEIYCLTCRLER
jgi:CBS domain-containing protein